MSYIALLSLSSVVRDARSLKHLPLAEVDIGLLADYVRVSSSDSLDLGEGEDDLSLSIDVGVEETQNVLELCGVTSR